MWSLVAPLALLLLPLPLLALRLLPPAEVAADSLVVLPTVAAGLARASRGRLTGGVRRTLPGLAWICFVLALAGPQQLAPVAALPVSGRDIILVLDLSGSMETEDFTLDGRTVQRLAAVQRVAATFARGRTGDRVGLVVFGEAAYFATPPTYDVEAVARAVEEATIGLSGRSTAISDGLGLALKRLAQSTAPSRVVILLSDGRDTSGTVAPIGTAALASRLGVRVHTIAMGLTAVGEAGAPRDSVDAPTLAAMAAATGGTAFRVRTTEDLAAVGAQIDAMEPDLRPGTPRVIHRPYWPWPATLGCLAMLGVLADRRSAR